MGQIIGTQSNNCQQKTCFPIGCMSKDSLQNQQIDSNELDFKVTNLESKGKFTKNSILNLTKEEIYFFKACASRNLPMVRYYLKKGVNINTLDENRTSPLHIGARYASYQIVEELLNWGGSQNITDLSGWTPLHISAHFKRPKICFLLLESGANPYIVNRDNETPWDMVNHPQTEEVFQQYFNKIKQINVDQKQSDIFHKQNKRKSINVVKKLQVNGYQKLLGKENFIQKYHV